MVTAAALIVVTDVHRYDARAVRNSPMCGRCVVRRNRAIENHADRHGELGCDCKPDLFRLTDANPLVGRQCIECGAVNTAFLFQQGAARFDWIGWGARERREVWG